MVAKKGLGKGLGALIPKAESEGKKEEANVSRETSMLNINLIEPNSTQPRRRFDEDALVELADSIKLHGVIQPIVVQKKDDHYEIIAGERRWRASRIAKLKEVPVVIKDYSEDEIFEIALIENIQRQDLNPIEEAQAYQRLIEERNLKQDEVAEKVSKSRVAIANSLRLLRLDERIREMIIDELISSGHARALLSITDPELQYELANRILDEKLSVRETEKLVKKYLNPKSKKEKKKLDDEAIYREYEDRLRSILGVKTEITRKDTNKGKIEISFNNTEEFEKIYDIIKAGN
ncbi:MAG: ParB/RepB/Spo0J family partition protein [Lachnospiraceae bacterium]|nr:ParB/RepB/Spo0J family partition protein [Lachnospiraceae bacterium]MBO4762900.1 ParB/RepB/Spo0J family partition protein [Lachnospiraceae bacterium]MBQ6090620.1 ParB/RepB/Spo0J family partition protein [Lachnospiraceae bacterium]MBR5368451.1 ParB/RepB/Spo0J family partition protein [Lachnospiraceae bacterium]